MSRNRYLSVLLLVLLVLEGSDALHRNLLAVDDSPSPSPIPSVNSVQNSVNPVKTPAKGKSETKDPKRPPISHGAGPSESTPGSAKHPPEESHIGDCGASDYMCSNGSLVACVQNGELLIQNKGKDVLDVNIAEVASQNTTVKCQVAGHQAKKMPIKSDISALKKIVLTTKNENCTITVSSPTWIDRIPNYATMHMTPIYGAYAIFLIIMVGGGTWACCKFKRRCRRADCGVPYQELEMGMPQPTSTHNGTATSDNWDQGWDDDWEDDNKPAGGALDKRHAGSVSANGLASRSTSKEGWDDDWDD
ncbi:hypothetical protein QJS04_geneDACA017005 [Acorus gramineus]|uniref:DUF7356 domain-containing protein n=1 Tax=Acorus gramineus TaxID=55184 RepID=A0AAV9AMI6_ACOGR|nr:hypothetical protein QJS04_geneDACA017005 [Acorus gramineus]